VGCRARLQKACGGRCEFDAKLALHQTASKRMRLSLFQGSNEPSRKEGPMGYAYEHHIPSRAEIVVGMLADAIRRWSDRREFAEFMHIWPAEADRMARDLNVDKATLLEVASQGNESPALLNRRLRLLGIDPEELRRSEPAVAQDLVRCCALCGSKSRCARDMAREPRGWHWRDYCPNTLTLEMLQSQRAGAPAAL
jgi:hypothetical protein